MNLLLQALREEIEDNKHTRDPAKIAVNTALKRVANRYERLLVERQKERIARAERREKELDDLLNEVMGGGGQG